MDVRNAILFVLVGMLVSTFSVEAWFLRGARKYSGRNSRISLYVKDFYGGSKDMWRNYKDMKEANTIGADKYFHAKGNYEAARRGPGGRHAAAIISNAREGSQMVKDFFTGKKGDYAADQEANRWGRNGGDPNKYRPRGLDPKYRK